MSQKPIVIFSGCAWGDTGGAQRPVQLAYRMAQAGRHVLYRSEIQQRRFITSAGDNGGLIDVGPADASERVLDSPEGIAIVCLPSYWSYASQLPDAWQIVYDYLDWWDGFVEMGCLPPEVLDHEPELLAYSSLVVCSSEQLTASAKLKMPTVKTETILNGGPEEMTEHRHVNRGKATNAAFAGYLFGPWLDWEVMHQVATCSDIRLHMIGKHTADTDVRDQYALHKDEYRWYGEMPYVQCLSTLSRMDVGLIPFRGELCNYVDPIKHYDYAAAGLWSVCTPDLWPMLEKEYSLIAHAADFPEAIREARRMAQETPVPAEYVERNSWAVRTEQYLKALDNLEPRPKVWAFMDEAEPKSDLWPNGTRSPDRVNKTQLLRPRADHLPAGLAEEDCPLRVTLAAPSSCNMQPPCPYCSNAADRAGRPPLAGNPNAWTRGLLELGEQHGPLYLSACFGEPLSDPDTVRVLAAVARDNKVDLVSNIIAPPTVLAPFSRNGNTRIATSYHPHYWATRGGLSGFLAQRANYQSSGIDCGSILMVAHPFDLPWLAPDVRKAEEGTGADVRVMPFHGVWQGRQYPDAYDVDERRVVDKLMARTYDLDRDFTQRSPRGMRCRAGMDYVYVDPDGLIRQCYMGGEVLGNLLTQTWEIATEPMVCRWDTCPCPDMWEYVAGEFPVEAPADYIPPLRREMSPMPRAIPAQMYRYRSDTFPEDSDADFQYINPRRHWKGSGGDSGQGARPEERRSRTG